MESLISANVGAIYRLWPQHVYIVCGRGRVSIEEVIGVDTGWWTDREEHRWLWARREVFIGLMAVLAFVAVAGVTHAAAPAKNAIYAWSGSEKTGSGLRFFKVELHVAPSRKTATATFYCGTTASSINPDGSTKAFPVASNDSFNGQVNLGTSADLWGIKGSFTTAKTAAAVFHTSQYNTCDATLANYNVKLTAG